MALAIFDLDETLIHGDCASLWSEQMARLGWVDGKAFLKRDHELMEAYGKGGQRAMRLGQLHNLARLYWYTVEFGLIQEEDGLRIYGAGILSSPHETVFALEDASPNRIGFDLKRLMRTKYIIDDFQQTYFVIPSFEALLETCYKDFGDVYAEVKGLPDYDANELVPGDDVITRGTLKYFKDGGRKGAKA